MEVFTLPHVFHAESVQSPSCPSTVLGLNSDFFLALYSANLENLSPNLVLGQSEDSLRTARTLGLYLDGVRGLNSDCPQTVLGPSDYCYLLLLLCNIIKNVQSWD
jgi:hypothetical protein